MPSDNAEVGHRLEALAAVDAPAHRPVRHVRVPLVDDVGEDDLDRILAPSTMRARTNCGVPMIDSASAAAVALRMASPFVTA